MMEGEQSLMLRIRKWNFDNGRLKVDNLGFNPSFIFYPQNTIFHLLLSVVKKYVDSRGIEPLIPDCQPGVLPVNYEPD